MSLFSWFFKVFTVHPQSLSLNIGDSAMLNVNAGASFVSLTPTVATVDASGLVIARSNGRATISVVERATGVQRLVEVTVGDVAPAPSSTTTTTTPLTIEQRIVNLERKAHTH